MIHINAGFGQNGLANIKAQLLCVIWPGARVEVENEVVPPVIPRWKALYFSLDIVNVLAGQLVPVQSVNAQHKQTGLVDVCGLEAGILDSCQDLLVALRHRLPLQQGVDVHLEPPLAAAEVEACVHAAPPALVDVVTDLPSLPGRGVLVVEERAVLLLLSVLQVGVERVDPLRPTLSGQARAQGDSVQLLVVALVMELPNLQSPQVGNQKKTGP